MSTTEAAASPAGELPPDPTGAGVRVRTHPGLCEGWGNCHRFAPEVYPLDDDGHVDVHLLEVPPELADAARLGAAACPERAITVIEPWVQELAGDHEDHTADRRSDAG